MSDKQLTITSSLTLDLDEVQMHAVRSSGAGGQNVNKVASAIHLQFDSAASSLPGEVKARLLALNDRRINSSGIVTIKSQTHRTQERNRAEALQRLAELLRNATFRPKKRRPTRPTKASKERRLQAKKQQSVRKAERKKPDL